MYDSTRCSPVDTSKFCSDLRGVLALAAKPSVDIARLRIWVFIFREPGFPAQTRMGGASLVTAPAPALLSDRGCLA